MAVDLPTFAGLCCLGVGSTVSTVGSTVSTVGSTVGSTVTAVVKCIIFLI